MHNHNPALFLEWLFVTACSVSPFVSPSNTQEIIHITWSLYSLQWSWLKSTLRASSPCWSFYYHQQHYHHNNNIYNNHNIINISINLSVLRYWLLYLCPSAPTPSMMYPLNRRLPSLFILFCSCMHQCLMISKLLVRILCKKTAWIVRRQYS